MEKLPMCRICLAKNVPMSVVINKNLHELYMKLTDVPFVTEDSRPMVACYICCVKLKQCCRLMMKCLEAEQHFAEITNEDYKQNPIIKQDRLQFSGGLVKTSVESISIVDVGLTECVIVKEELPAVCESLDDFIEQTEEHQREDIKQENCGIGYSDEEHISFPSIKFEEDSEGDVPLMEFKTEVKEEQDVSEQKQSAMEINSPAVAEEPEQHMLRTKLEDSIPADQKTNQISDSKMIGATQNRSTVAKKPKKDTRRTILEDTIAAKQKKYEQRKMSHSKVIQSTHIRMSNPVTTFIAPFTDTKPRIYSFKNNTAIDTSLRSNRKRGDLSSKLWTNKDFADIKENVFKCKFCQRCFSHKGHLTRHVRGHTGEKPYQCEVCQRSFSQFSNLKRHIRIHTGDKPYKCDLCQRCFIDKRDLTKHIHVHIGEKPYECKICQFSFNDKRDLTKHIRKHTGEKPFDCGLCRNSFRDARDLKRHIRIHTGEKPYQCDICQRNFNVKSNLKRHIIAHSGEKPFTM